jgi:prepilin signal peptidase PulO-like enzyme (type II secretory pathway)
MPPNQVIDLPSMYIVGLIGLFAGGIASYIANLLLFEEGFVSPIEAGSYCGHKGNVMEAIPFVSLLLLNGKCKSCRRRIQWQYLLSEVLMAIAFIVLAWRFGLNLYSFGMMLFVAVLVAICITDFKAKIIPHEITYPAIIVGVIFSALIKADVLGALAGIGVSYIFFDFLAFYGLKLYLYFNPPTLDWGKTFLSGGDTQIVQSKKVNRGLAWVSKELQPVIKKVSKKGYRNLKFYSRGIPLEELEIIGGGDAVLSALISAWLGWQKLVTAIIVGFLAGTVMGAIYVLIELRKERLLQNAIVPVLSSMIGLLIFAACMLLMLATSLKESVFLMPYQYILPAAAFIGSLLGVIIAGSKISKPFPFGPALAIGAIIAIFRRE